jgi:hypothetical protein
MRLSELVGQTRIPGEYLTYLKCVLEGDETDCTEEDLEAAVELEQELTDLVLEEDD